MMTMMCGVVGADKRVWGVETRRGRGSITPLVKSTAPAIARTRHVIRRITRHPDYVPALAPHAGMPRPRVADRYLRKGDRWPLRPVAARVGRRPSPAGRCRAVQSARRAARSKLSVGGALDPSCPP